MPSKPEVANARRRQRYSEEPEYRTKKLTEIRTNYEKNGEKHKKRKRDYYDPVKERDALLRKKYGISLVEYNEILLRQNNACAICLETKVDKIRTNMCVDHDHRTGKVRGILCFMCNKGLGHFKDSPTLLRLGAAYLESN